MGKRNKHKKKNPAVTPANESKQKADETKVQIQDHKDCGFNLIDGEEKNRIAPETFKIPTRKRRDSLKIGEYASIGFESCSRGERFWAKITQSGWDNTLSAGRTVYYGTLEEPLVYFPLVKPGESIDFDSRHVLNWVTSDEMAKANRLFKEQGSASAKTFIDSL